MNPNHNDSDKLAESIDTQLKSLPDLQAPATLLPRVMGIIQAQASLPWHRRSWQTWPMPLQVVLVLGLTLGFAGLYLLVARIPQSSLVLRLTNEIQSGLALASVIWSALSAVAGAAERLIKSMNLSPAILAGCGAAVVLGYMACLGVGAIYLKLALTRKKNDNL
jgi:hypothetical protein